MANLNERAFCQWSALLDSIRHHGMADSWIVLCAGVHLGDTFLICSLARSFVETHGAQSSKLLLITSEAQREIPSLFHPYVTRSLVYPGLNVDIGTEFNRFSLLLPGTPFIPHAYLYGDGQLPRFLDIPGINNLHLTRYMLRLDWNAPVMPPVIPENLTQRAKEVFLRHELASGRTVVLFPRSQHLKPVEWPLWETLAARLRQTGWTAVTNTVGNEPPVPGTKGVEFSIGEAIPFCEQCGWVISSRSGICDVLAYAECRKTIFYDKKKSMLNFGFGSMEIGNNIDEHIVSSDSEFDQWVDRSIV